MKFIKDYFLPLLTVATPILVGLLTWSVNVANTRLSNEIAQIDRNIKEIEQHRKERESHQAYVLQVLKEVKTALKENDNELQRVVIGLVESMPDKQLAEIWLSALQLSDNTTAANKLSAKKAKNAVAFDRVQQQVAFRPRPVPALGLPSAGSFKWETYDYDIFWCEKSGKKAKALALQIVNEMKRQGAKGRVRGRVLPEKVNARSGYGISGFEIRPNPNELKQAEALQKLGNKILGDLGTFRIGQTEQPTRYYLSAFLCP